MGSTVAETRQSLIDQIMWSDGGAGWGVCAVGNMMMAQQSKQTLKSIVSLQGSPDEYTDEELAKVVEFSKIRDERHRKICGEILIGDNVIFLRKMDGKWLRKRRSWDIGPMFSDSLDEAMAFMEEC